MDLNFPSQKFLTLTHCLSRRPTPSPPHSQPAWGVGLYSLLAKCTQRVEENMQEPCLCSPEGSLEQTSWKSDWSEGSSVGLSSIYGHEEGTWLMLSAVRKAELWMEHGPLPPNQMTLPGLTWDGWRRKGNLEWTFCLCLTVLCFFVLISTQCNFVSPRLGKI
jgi:hypothetical protein